MNYDIIKFYESGYPQYWSKFKDIECGWAKALEESKASYKRKMLIEKPGKPLSKQSPAPSPTKAEEEMTDVHNEPCMPEMKKSKR